MTAAQLTSISAVALSLAFSYIPGLNRLYDDQTPTVKRLVMLALLILVTAGIFATASDAIVYVAIVYVAIVCAAIACAAIACAACTGLGPHFDIQITCDQGGGLGLLQILITALIANQSAYLISPRRDRDPSITSIRGLA